MASREKFSTVLRRKVQFYEDPYLLDLKPDEVAICRECRSVYAGKRWELESQAARDLAQAGNVIETLCPACQKVRDRMPGGVVTLSGDFIKSHEDEILSLIQHENQEAMEINPLERIMEMDKQSDGSLIILTTNEKLAQRIGRAVHKAYSGDVEYKWSKGTKLARVYWRRD